jgi:2-aminoadipate transaminase
MDRIERLLSNRARTSRSSAIRDLLHLLERPGLLSLAGGLPAAEAFPLARIQAALDRVLAERGPYGASALQYGATEGLSALRGLLARQAHAADGRTVSADIVVTTGSQQALDLLARTLLDPGDIVVAERPAYLGSLQAFTAAGAEVVTVGSDDDGMCTDELERRLRRGLRPKALSVVPNFQNPSGTTLAVERRVHLAGLAERYGFVVIEDDPYRALRFTGQDVAPIRAHTDLAVTLGSTSKTIAPGLRVGWLAAPRALVGPLVRAKQTADLHTSTFAQHLVVDLLGDDAFLVAHIARLRALYRERAAALAGSLAARFGDAAQFVEPAGGFFLWVRFPGVDTTAALEGAVDNGVAYVPGTAFTVDGRATEHARLSFASLGPGTLDEAVRRLAVALVPALTRS